MARLVHFEEDIYINVNHIISVDIKIDDMNGTERTAVRMSNSDTIYSKWFLTDGTAHHFRDEFIKKANNTSLIDFTTL